jgi:hypothetical protein
MMNHVKFSRRRLVRLAALFLLWHVSTGFASSEAADHYAPQSACLQGTSILQSHAAMDVASRLLGSPLLTLSRARFHGPCESLQYSALPRGHQLRQYTSSVIALSAVGGGLTQQEGHDMPQQSPTRRSSEGVSKDLGVATLQMVIKVSEAAPQGAALVLSFTSSGLQHHEHQHRSRDLPARITILNVSQEGTAAMQDILPPIIQDLQVSSCIWPCIRAAIQPSFGCLCGLLSYAWPEASLAASASEKCQAKPRVTAHLPQPASSLCRLNPIALGVSALSRFWGA